MAKVYIPKINYDDPRYQKALRQVDKGHAAIKRLKRGHVTGKWAAQQGARLTDLEYFGRKQKSEADYWNARMAIAKERLGMERDKLKAAKEGFKWSLPIQLGGVFLSYQDAKRERLFQEREAEKMKRVAKKPTAQGLMPSDPSQVEPWKQRRYLDSYSYE